MTRRNWVILTVIATLPLIGQAEGPSTRPANSTATLEPSSGVIEGNGPAGRLNHWRNQPPPTTAEWNDISAYMKQLAPEQMRVISNLPDEPRRTRLMSQANRNYQMVQRAQNEQPELRQLILDQIRLQDQIFKLANQIRVAKRNGESRTADQAELKRKISELVDTNLKERQLRLSRLDQTVREEKQLLAEDSNNRDELIEKRLGIFLGAPVAEASPLETKDQTTGELKSTTQP